MQIREARAGEGPLIAQEFWYPLAREMQAHSELNELTDEAVESAREGFENLLAQDQRFIYLLEVEGTGVGFVSVEVGERPTRKKGRYASVTDLFMKEGYRGRGYGTALLERVEEVAEEESCDFLRVSAEWENREAREFYEKCGYERKQVTYANTLE